MKTANQHVLHSRTVLLCLLALFFSFNIMAQKPMEKRSFEISLEADEAIQSVIKNDKRINVKTGTPIALYGLNYEVPEDSPESMAMYYLEHESAKLGIPKSELENLHHHATRTTNAGSVVRYRQYYRGYPVNKAEVTITISPENRVVYIMNSYVAFKSINTIPSVSEERALELAKNHISINAPASYTNNRVMVYNNPKMTRLAHEVTILTSDPLGEWHVFVDAQTEEIFKVVDMNQYYSGHEKDKKVNKAKKEEPKVNEIYRRRVDGACFVFDPDPLSSNMVAYGGGYVDGNDADTPQLTAARISATLNDITFSGGMYSLVGPLAQIVDFDTPNTGLFAQATPDFNFTRNEQGFEPANTYYHIDYMMNYINNTLGCDVMPYQYTGGVKFDPHGAGGADQSYYTPGTAQLSFGEGCVDDAEDSDVIHHELGHGLHDWVTAGGYSGAEGLGEGTGDYVAQSYNRGLGYWGPGDAQYNWVFNWDGHNECWNGRVTNYGATYPGGLTGSIHTDGQIWATCLMEIWDQIGQQEMDKIFWEGLGMTAGTTGQNDAAVAVYQAAVNLGYTNDQINTIHSSLTDCGYTLPALPGPPSAAFSADNETICLDTNNMVTFTDETVPTATSWSWTFEGGTPATSTDQNPTVTYAADGTYDVTLEVTNSFGTDTVTLTDYISVVSGDACPSCTIYSSATTLGLAIPDGTGGSGEPGEALTNVINVPDDVIIDYITVNVDISHTWIADLIITIIHPDGTPAVVVWDRSCAAVSTGLDVTFIDGEPAIVCAGATVGDYAPVNPLSVFSGLNSAGDWTISMTDNWSADTGVLNDWSIEICSSPTASIEESQFEIFSIYPNPSNGEFTLNLNSTSNEDINVTVYDIRGRSVYHKTYDNTSDFSQVVNLNAVQSGVYLVSVSDGERKTIKRIIIE
ncbi:T9SS type A sorting domain-containing protein [Lacinutrix iliipiscaria]|uniref:T9SS type A sorting domain-containing protein n=1 Tax=Lacinutrix iliipiscaria TaxID=1230532 RepID=A0ABW5WM40_9FLAO